MQRHGELAEALGGAKIVQSYGKAALVGLAGELEHGALWHAPGGYSMREVLGGTKAIVPSNKRWGVDEILAASKRYVDRTKRRVTFEYACIAGVNDHAHQADALADRLRGFRGGAHVNLIPLNPTSGFPGRAPDPDRVFLGGGGIDVLDAVLRRLPPGGVVVANYAKTHPTKTFIIGTAASQDPTMQIAPKNVFRYHGDGAQWNAGLGEILYKKNGWRTAAIIMDDYSFGWTSAAGIIADFCAIGGQITKRVFPPLNTTDYAPYVQQLPAPNQVDGYFWVVGGTGTGASVKAFEQAYGALNPKQHAGNLFFAFLGADKEVGPKVVGSYVGGFGTAPGLKTAAAKKYEAVITKWYGPSKIPAADGFVYNYYNAAWALVRGLQGSNGAVGAKLQASKPRTNASTNAGRSSWWTASGCDA